MGLFKKDPLKQIFEDYELEDGKDILEQARAISQDDSQVVKAVGYAVAEPLKYFKNNAARFKERGIDFNNHELAGEFEPDDLLMVAMTDELKERGYSVEVDVKCGLEDFLRALEQLKTYYLIADAIPEQKNKISGIFTDEGDVDVWIEEINGELDGKAYVLYNDIGLDSYPLIIVTPEVFRELEDSEEEPAERDAIGDYNLKINLAQTAAGLLVQGTDYKELANTKCVFGYLYDIRDHGIEALYKLETDMTTAYFAAQGDKLMRLNFNEELFQTIVDGFLDARGKSDK